MKVLMLGWELPPHNSGGLGVACFQLCKALSRSGADIEFLLPYTVTNQVDFMKLVGVTSHDANEVMSSGSTYDSFDYINPDGSKAIHSIAVHQAIYEHSVAKLVSYKEFDIIHAHDWLTFRAGIRAKEISGRPLIVHVHSVERDRAGGDAGNPMVREIESIAFLLADKIIAVSEHTKKAICDDYNIPADKIDVVHNSIDHADVEPLDETNTYKYLTRMQQNGYKVVVNIGRLTVQKGLHNLLLAAQKVIQKQPKTLFLIVGSGELQIELLTAAADLGIGDKVLFAGFQRGKAWRDAFAVADLFVMPSLSEPFGLTPLEATGYGTPSLISKQSGVSEIFRSCLKVDYWDVDEMANKIVNILREPALSETLIQNAQEEYLKLSWLGSAQKLMHIYSHQSGVTA